MNSKAFNAFEGNENKVEELRTYLRWTKRLFVFTLLTAIVNILLTYGLIFHSSKPGPTTCAQFCPHTGIEPLASFHNDINEDSYLSARDQIMKDLVVRTSEERIVSDISTRSAGELAERVELPNLKGAVIVAMAGYWVTGQAFAWWNMVPACQDFGSSPTNKANCVWGAVSTVVTAAGSGIAVYTGLGKVSTWMNNNGISLGGWKRDVVDQELLDGLTEWFGSNVTHLGVWDYSHLKLGGTLEARTDTAPLDVFGMTSASGHDIHFSYLGNGNGKPTFKFGFGSGTNTTTISRIKGRDTESYDYQYFTDGGIDFILDPNPEDGGTLDTYSDYWWVYDQVSCIMNMGNADTAAGHYFQIYDTVNRGTIAGGAIAPFRGSDHWSAISVMYNIPTPLLETTQCSS